MPSALQRPFSNLLALSGPFIDTPLLSVLDQLSLNGLQWQGAQKGHLKGVHLVNRARSWWVFSAAC